jgi:hypothetical protein
MFSRPLMMAAAFGLCPLGCSSPTGQRPTQTQQVNVKANPGTDASTGDVTPLNGSAYKAGLELLRDYTETVGLLRHGDSSDVVLEQLQILSERARAATFPEEFAKRFSRLIDIGRKVTKTYEQGSKVAGFGPDFERFCRDVDPSEAYACSRSEIGAILKAVAVEVVALGDFLRSTTAELTARRTLVPPLRILSDRALVEASKPVTK